MKQRSGSSSLSALKLKSFASLVKWCVAHYTRHMKCHVSLRDLYGLCVNARTNSGKSQAVWMNQNQTIPGWFPEHITRVFSGISVWKRLRKQLYINSMQRCCRVLWARAHLRYSSQKDSENVCSTQMSPHFNLFPGKTDFEFSVPKTKGTI